jgi:hypothetical protein
MTIGPFVRSAVEIAPARLRLASSIPSEAKRVPHVSGHPHLEIEQRLRSGRAAIST